MMKFRSILLVGSLIAGIGNAIAAPIDVVTGIEIGSGSAVFEAGETASTWFPSAYIGLTKQVSNRFYVTGSTGIEMAAFSPGTDQIGGNMVRGKASLALSYRLPITVFGKTRFFLSGFADAGYGAYGTLHETRWSYLWESYDDVSRFELSGGAKINAEYRPSVDFGATVNASCDVSLNNYFSGCRAGLGFRF